jgi:hypothetical protein
MINFEWNEAMRRKYLGDDVIAVRELVQAAKLLAGFNIEDEGKRMYWQWIDSVFKRSGGDAKRALSMFRDISKHFGVSIEQIRTDFEKRKEW